MCARVHAFTQVQAITSRTHEVDGVPTSLADLGFDRVGIDSGWSACSGPNGSWHDGTTGQFIINTTKFPDMKAMVDQGHALGVKMDMYLNQARSRKSSSLLVGGRRRSPGAVP
jgi:hypothetical protein